MSWIPWIAAADNHGNLGCEVAKKKLLSFCETWKPKHRIHLGDLWDFSPLRRGASQEEKADGIADDYHLGAGREAVSRDATFDCRDYPVKVRAKQE